MLHESFSDTQIDRDRKQRFREEVKKLALLKNPYIVRLIETHFDQDIRPYIVMAYAPGGNLRGKHPEGTLLPLETIRIYANQLAAALAYAHQNAVIHCDVKPANVLLDQDGNLLLSDFGISRISESTLPQTTREPFGTPTYMAPEQFKGRWHEATDQYALAIMVYEWFCGHPPFSGENQNKLMDLHMNMPVPSLRAECAKCRTDISEETLKNVEPVISKALEKEPDERYSSVLELIKDLNRAFIASETTGLLPPQSNAPVMVPYQPDQRYPLPRRVVVVAGAAALIVLGTTGGGVIWFVTHASPPPSVHAPRTSVPSPSPSPKSVIRYTYTGHAGHVQGIAWSPDGNSIASAGEDHTIQIWNPKDGTLLQICRGHSDIVYRVVWSHDGARLASSSKDGTVKIWDVGTGKNIQTYTGHQAHAVYNLDWSQKADLIASCGNDGTIQVWDPNTSDETIDTPRVVFQSVPIVSIWGLSWSPDGKSIVSSSESTNNNIQVWDATQQSATPITNPTFTCDGHTNTAWKVVWSPDGRRIASASADGTSRIWNGMTGSLQQTYKGANSPSDSVWYIAWSPSGNYLASSYKAGNVQIWSADTARKVFQYNAPTNPPIDHRVVCSVWKPNSTLLASSSFDGTVRTWESGLQ
jgi:WD40 repeat protein